MAYGGEKGVVAGGHDNDGVPRGGHGFDGGGVGGDDASCWDDIRPADAVPAMPS